jgi:methylated-DNA-[protein]-cysteine S-methyltransferase
MLYYAIFRTRWGYFGLMGTENAVCRTFLPAGEHRQAEQGLLRGLGHVDAGLQPADGLQRSLQARIAAYYEGEPVDFSAEPAVSLDGSGPFGQSVLEACRKIRFGCTKTYIDLARQVGRPGAARAVGRVMAGNPIPLIIPCHRVLRTDGGLGGFSAPGGIATKQQMLRHEQSIRGMADPAHRDLPDGF